MAKKRKARREAEARATAEKTREPAPSRRAQLIFLGLSVLSGVLWFLSCADFDVWPFAWVAMVPALYVIERAPTRRRALLYGWLAGIVANAGGFYWIVGLLERFAHLHFVIALFLFLLLCAYQAVVFLLFTAAVRKIRAQWDLPMALVAPVVMVAFELCVPFIFPWYLAITQAWNPHVIQVADLTGPLGVTALLMMVNGAVYDLATLRRRRLVAGLVSAGILLAALGYGHLRLGQVDRLRAAAPKLEVGIVQPNVAFDIKGDKNRRARQLVDLQRASAELEQAGVDLIVWPESSYPFAVHRDAPGDYPEDHKWRIRRGFTKPLFFGSVTGREDAEYDYNSALLLESDGTFRGRFDKIFLLMFGEYIPGLKTFPWIRKWLPKAAGHFERGTEIVTFPFEHEGQPYRLGPMICYEDILPAFGRELGSMHPHLMVNITNDAWFGDTSEPWEHLALAVYRSVELRTDLVRAVNTGVSAFVDAAGRVRGQSYAVDPKKTPKGVDTLRGTVVLMEGGHTFYARFGDVFGYLCAGATGLAWLVVPLWRRRRTTTSDPPAAG